MMLKLLLRVKRSRMLRRKNNFLFLSVVLFTGSVFAKTFPADKTVTRFAFGSCQKAEKGLGIYKAIGKLHPQFMVLAGDNIYASTIEDKEKKYSALKEEPNYKKFVSRVPVYAIWDDNDYGKNDAGGEYPFRAETEKLFKNFFGLAETLGGQDGIYRSHIFGPAGKRVQLILLDTRSFRSLPKLSPTPLPIGIYVANEDKSATVLGDAQWKWLEEELKKPAEVRFIVTGYQYLAVDTKFEGWINFPLERERLAELIKKTQAGGVIFISGDRHMSMFLHESKDRPYEFWEITSSGLTEALPDTAPVDSERTLDGKLYFGPSFGWIQINWPKKQVDLEIRNEKGKVVRNKTIALKSLNVTPEIK